MQPILVTKAVLDTWKVKAPECFTPTKYGTKKTHTSGRRETRLGFYSLNIVKPAQVNKMSFLQLSMRRTYVKDNHGSLRRVEVGNPLYNAIKLLQPA